MDVAGNESTPVITLHELAHDEDEDIQKIVAKNPSTAANTLRFLIQRYSTLGATGLHTIVAENPNTPVDGLKTINKVIDGGKYDPGRTRRALANNPKTPTPILVHLANDVDVTTRIYVAKNVSTPPEVLERLTQDEDLQTRKSALAHPNLPDHIKAIASLSE
jgi:hypothetical protein